MEVPVIDITDLSKFYGRIRGIEHIDLKIEEGEIFGFIGPNGSGKTTTIRILLNLIFPTGGSARIMGMDVIRDTKKIKYLTGYVPSDAGVYSCMDVKEFLIYCTGFHNVKNGIIRLHELAELFELSHILAEVQMLCKRVAVIKEGKIIQVEDIANLRKKQLRKVFIEFGDQADKKTLILPGIINAVEGPGNSMTFMYSGNINDLISLLAGKKMINLQIEDPSLEEIFMHYYK